ncbi:RNA polymerase sigma factor SigA [Halioglobus japonicus]|nr:RNA polymerase sigma factor SigA [Halioglobus japonicus]
MNSLSKSHDDQGLDWLFAQAREYPLLTSIEEHDIDARKWQARDAVLESFLADASGRKFFRHWVINLLNNPPNLKEFQKQEYYYLLRREQDELLKDSNKAALLNRLLKQLAKPDSASARSAVLHTLSQLNLTPLLVTGLAEVLLDSKEPAEITTALRYWRQFWDASIELNTCEPRVSEVHREALHHQIRVYLSARDKLVNHNLRLVFSIAGKMQSATVPYSDRVQSGVLGLLRAAEKFDYRTGHRFSTYAYNWISQSARRMLEDQRAIVRLPAGVNEQVNRLYRERLSYLNINGEEAGVQVLADRLQMEPEEVKRLQQIGNLSVSLDSTFNDDPGEQTLGDKLSGWTYSPPAARAEQLSLNRCLMTSLKDLTPQEQRVIALRWGLDNSQPLSRREMADNLSVSTERIRQLEVSALRKLRDDENVAQAFLDYQGDHAHD